MHTSHVMFRLKPGFGCEIKSSSLSSQLSMFSSTAAVPPLWCRCQRADGGRLRHLWKRRHLFPLHRAETGVICLTINIFMNTINALTSSSVKFRVTQQKLIWSVSFLKTSKVKDILKGRSTQLAQTYFLSSNSSLPKQLSS